MPIYIVMLDLWYGLLLNIGQSLNEPVRTASNIIPTVPNVAFNWLQVLVNTGMVIILSFALLQLLVLNKAIAKKLIFKPNAFRILGLVLTLAFSIPACYGLIMSGFQLAQGHLAVSFGNLRYLISALCIAYCAPLCIYRLFGWRRQYKTQQINIPIKNVQPNQDLNRHPD